MRAADAEGGVRLVLEAQVAAWNRGDLEGYMQGYWRSPDQSGESVVKGWQATFERYKKRYQSEGREMGRLSFRALEISVLAPDAAFVRGAWRIVHDHTS